MSYNYYPAGVYGMKVEDLFPAELAEEIRVAYMAAYDDDENELVDDLELETDLPVYKPRYAKIMTKRRLREFAGEPGEFVQLAFKAECEKYIPGYRKMKRFAGFHRVDADAMGDVDGGEIMFGIGVYAFPLGSREKVTDEFRAKAQMTLWVTGG